MDEFKKLLLNFKKRIQQLERNYGLKTLRFGTDSVLEVPKKATETGSEADGEIWYNTTSNKYKGKENGTVVTFTTS